MVTHSLKGLKVSPINIGVFGVIKFGIFVWAIFTGHPWVALLLFVDWMLD